MKRLMLVAVIAAIAVPTWLTALTKSYDVVPYADCVAQTIFAPPNSKVTQFYRNTLDSLTSVSVSIGDTITDQPYAVWVYDSVTGLPVAYNSGRHATQCWAWLSFPLTKDAQPVRGRTYGEPGTLPQFLV